MSKDYCGPDGNIMILACSGCANVGQLSNQAALELTREGFGKMSCLAGIGGGLSRFIRSAKDAPQLVTIDGCSVGCAKAILEHTKIPMKSYIVVTDLEIEKNGDFNLRKEDIQKVKEAVRHACSQKLPVFPMAETGSCSCCD